MTNESERAAFEKLLYYHLNKFAYYTDEQYPRAAQRHQAFADTIRKLLAEQEKAEAVGEVFGPKAVSTMVALKEPLPPGTKLYLHAAPSTDRVAVPESGRGDVVAWMDSGSNRCSRNKHPGFINPQPLIFAPTIDPAQPSASPNTEADRVAGVRGSVSNADIDRAEIAAQKTRQGDGFWFACTRSRMRAALEAHEAGRAADRSQVPDAGPDRSVPPCLDCGAIDESDAEKKCICSGDKDDCHGVQLWPDDVAKPAPKPEAERVAACDPDGERHCANCYSGQGECLMVTKDAERVAAQGGSEVAAAFEAGAQFAIDNAMASIITDDIEAAAESVRTTAELADIPTAYADEHNQYVWWNSNAETAEAIKDRGFTPLNKIRATPAEGSA